MTLDLLKYKAIIILEKGTPSSKIFTRQVLICMIRNSFWLTQTRIRHYFQHLLIRKNNNIAIRPRLLRCSWSKMRSLKNIQRLWYFFFFFCELASFSPWSVKEWTTLKILLKLVPWQQKHFRPLLQRSSSEEKKPP